MSTCSTTSWLITAKIAISFARRRIYMIYAYRLGSPTRLHRPYQNFSRYEHRLFNNINLIDIHLDQFLHFPQKIKRINNRQPPLSGVKQNAATNPPRTRPRITIHLPPGHKTSVLPTLRPAFRLWRLNTHPRFVLVSAGDIR